MTPRETPTDIEPTPQEQALIDQLITALNTGVEQAENYADTAEECAQQAIEVLRDINQTVADALQEAKDSGEFDGKGIESAVFNSDYTLTLNFTDGTSFTTPPIKGEKGDKGDKGDKGEDTAYLAFSQPPILRRVHGTQIQPGSVMMKFAAYKNGERIPCVGTSYASASEYRVTTVNATATADGTITIAWSSGFDPTSGESQAFLYTFKFDGITVSHWMEINKVYDGAKGDKGDTGEVSEAELEQTKYSLAPVIVDNTNGAIASMSDGADGYPVKSLVVNLEPIQAGTGDPSPTNIRPISGRTECNVTQAGKNLFGNWQSIQNCDMDTNNNVLVSYPSGRGVIVLPIVPNTQYTLSYPNGTTGLIYPRLSYGLYTNYPAIGDTANVMVYSVQQSITFTTGSTDKYLVVQLSLGAWENTLANAEHAQLEYGTTATEYEQYNGTTYSTALGSTVYGGTLDVVSGELTLTHAIISKTVASMNNSEDYPGWRGVTELENCKGVTLGGNGSVYDILGNFGTYFGYNTTGANRILYLPKARYNNMTQSDWQTMYANETMQFLIELATPTTTTLTPQEVNSLLGENNIWANTGNVAVTYCADTKLYINKIMEG